MGKLLSCFSCNGNCGLPVGELPYCKYCWRHENLRWPAMLGVWSGEEIRATTLHNLVVRYGGWQAAMSYPFIAELFRELPLRERALLVNLHSNEIYGKFAVGTT